MLRLRFGNIGTEDDGIGEVFFPKPPGGGTDAPVRAFRHHQFQALAFDLSLGFIDYPH